MAWEPEGFGRTIFSSRHAAYADEPWADACKRVAWHVADAEHGQDRVKWFEIFRTALLDNLIMPGGRIWYGSGKPRGQLLNCFVIPTGDSREGWGKTLYDTVVISGTGGGVGLNCSPIRPRGTPIKGTGGFATGAVSLMSAVDAVGDLIKAGGGRRTALMLCLSLSHGDIVEFLDKKLDLGELNNANVSVVFDEDPENFFKLVREKADFPLMFQGKQVGSIPAHDLWIRVIKNALKGGEPGILNMHLANKMSNIGYLEPLISTNPCVTGDTMVAVADGRNAVSIKQLAEEGKDVPVYSVNPTTGETEIKMGINPRVTGKNAKVMKLTLDDGSVVRATPNHKFMLRDGTYCEMKDLKPGDSLKLGTKWQTSWNELFPNLNSRSADYWMVGSTKNLKNKFEHTLVMEHKIGKNVEKGYVVHHRDFNALNNSIDNLQLMKKEDHDAYHASLITGDKNPYHRMPDEWKQAFACHKGEENGMFGRENKWGHHTEEAKEAIRAANVGKKMSPESIQKMADARTAYYDKKYEEAGLPRFVTKTCPNKSCNKEFTVLWTAREQTYCSHHCCIVYMANNEEVNKKRSAYWKNKAEIKKEQWLKLYTARRFELKRDLGKSEWEEYLKSQGLPSRFSNATFRSLSDLIEAANNYNHRVVSVEDDGSEDVYNITVEQNHNFALAINETKTKTGKAKQNWLFTKQCGEIAMGAHECCCLGHLVLPRFIVDKKFDWDLFQKTIQTGVRFLDNVLTVNCYPLPEIQAKCTRYRRIGLGVMGLHHMLIELGFKYNSVEGLEFVDKLFKFLKNESYNASVDLAIEKGSFEAFDAEKVLRSNFIKGLRPALRERIRKHGLRNCALNTVAPTGTISMVSGVSSGVEPIFAMAYERRYRKGDEIAMEVVADPLFKKFVENGLSTANFQNAYDLSIRDHLEMQRTCQKHVDNAISKTISLPPGTSDEELSELLMEFVPDLKGVTVYPVGSRENQPLTPLPAEKAEELVFNAILESGGNDACKSGKCDI